METDSLVPGFCPSHSGTVVTPCGALLLPPGKATRYSLALWQFGHWSLGNRAKDSEIREREASRSGQTRRHFLDLHQRWDLLTGGWVVNTVTKTIHQACWAFSRIHQRALRLQSFPRMLIKIMTHPKSSSKIIQLNFWRSLSENKTYSPVKV